MTLLILALSFFLLLASYAAQSFNIARTGRVNRDSAALMMRVQRQPPMLDENTLWRLTVRMPQKDKGSAPVSAVARVRFIEERGYEPPSGKIFVEDDFSGIFRVNEQGYAASWTLSEDKDDRKDGLWVMGLFAQPKYPFLYFSLGLFPNFITVSGEEEAFSLMEGVPGVPGDKLNFIFSHTNNGEEGRVLSNGKVTYKNSEILNLPLTQVDIGEEVAAGTVELVPVYPDSSSSSSSSSSTDEVPQQGC
jgi:hypothetical protein